MEVADGCNGCQGKGKRVKWPTKWKKYDADILPALQVKQSTSDVSAYAFLRDRHWHEGQRMGWFGMSAKTECEIANPNGSVEEMVRRCKYRDDKTGAVVVYWNEPWEVWKEEFRKRFVEPLPDDAVLAVVDYHV
jgi:hypothetical protein